jgi:inorganic pyrophosphatase
MSKKTFILNKLVRDNIPDLLHKSGIIAYTQRLTPEELSRSLKDKLLEEASECQATQSQSELKEELADVLEVVTEILEQHNIDYAEIEKIRLDKQKEKGAFKTGAYISHVEIDEDNPHIKRYQNPFSQYVRQDFWQQLQNLFNSSEIVIDRPKHSAHPRYPTFIYPVDYGYLKGTAASDGNEVDIWIGSSDDKEINGILCTVDPIKKDAETKIIYACTNDEIAQICIIMNKVLKAIYISKN